MSKPNYRQIMEQKLGRPLKSSEIVHHINGNQHDDRPNNLSLFNSHKEHLKQPKRKIIITRTTIKSLMDLTQDKNINRFEDALKTFFSNRQIEIINRRLKNQRLSKTEAEMFSRSIKKKLRAIANNQLYNIATSMLGE